MILAIDVGGTHMNAVLIENDCIKSMAKVSTNTDDLIEMYFQDRDRDVYIRK